MSNTNDQSMQGQVVLITGATDGVGEATLRAIAGMGARVVGVGRNPQKIARVQDAIRRATGNDAVAFLEADLSEMAQVRALAAQFEAQYDRLDVLVNNAGALFRDRQETSEGLEMTFALNHMAYFLLTNLLLDMLKASAPARVVNVASDYQHDIDVDDLQFERGYSGWAAYGRSKTMNVLFTFELARRLEGTGVTANVMHPGEVRSNFHPAAGMSPMGNRTPEEGARTVVYLATSPEVAGVTGEYFRDERRARASRQAYDTDLQRQLWQRSAAIAGLEG